MGEQKEMPLDVPQVVVDDLPWSYKDEEPEGDDLTASSDSGAVQFLAALVERIAHGDVFVGQALVRNADCLAGPVLEVAVTKHLGAVVAGSLLQVSKLQHRVRVARLHSKVWAERTQNALGFGVTRLKAIQRTALRNAWTFVVVRAAESVRKERNRWLIHHPHLDARMVGGRDAVLVRCPLDSNVALAVN